MRSQTPRLSSGCYPASSNTGGESPTAPASILIQPRRPGAGKNSNGGCHEYEPRSNSWAGRRSSRGHLRNATSATAFAVWGSEEASPTSSLSPRGSGHGRAVGGHSLGKLGPGRVTSLRDGSTVRCGVPSRPQGVVGGANGGGQPAVASGERLVEGPRGDTCHGGVFHHQRQRLVNLRRPRSATSARSLPPGAGRSWWLADRRPWIMGVPVAARGSWTHQARQPGDRLHAVTRAGVRLPRPLPDRLSCLGDSRSGRVHGSEPWPLSCV